MKCLCTNCINTRFFTSLVKDMKFSVSAGNVFSPAVAYITCALVIAYVAAWGFPSKHVFSTTSNLCFLAAGLYRKIISCTDNSIPVIFGGVFDGSSLAFTLAGASSFFYHYDPEIGSHSHTLDILFAWVLPMHALFVCLTIVVCQVLPHHNVFLVCFNGCFFLIVVFGLVVLYDEIYSRQYLLIKVIFAVIGVVCLWLTVNNIDRSNRGALEHATLQYIVAVTIFVSALFAQSNMLGKNSNEDYDWYHGHWHYLIATLVSMVYSYAAAIVTNHAYRRLSWLDFFSFVLLFLYSIVVIVSKEIIQNIVVSRLCLTYLVCLLVLHAVFTLITYLIH
jgi:hypothetical protein